MKFNGRVTKRDYGVKGVLNHGNGNSRDYYKQRQEKTMQKVTEATIEQDLRVQEGKNRMDVINQRRMNEQRVVPALNRILKEGKDTLFKEIVCELYSKSLYLDDWFIDENREPINNFAKSYIDDNGGYSLLENAIKETNGNPFLVKLKKVIESNANRVVTRVNKELKNDKDIDPSTVAFSFDDEEESQFNMEKDDLALEEIAEVVKDKVLTVVKDEQQRSELEKNLEKDIKDEAEAVDESDDTDGDDDSEDSTDDDDVKESATVGDGTTCPDPKGQKVGVMDNSNKDDDKDADDVTESSEDDEDDDSKDVKESAFKTRAPFIELQKGVNEATLFNTIMRESMKEQMMESSVAFRNAGYALSDDDDDEDGYEYDVNSSVDDIIRDEFLGDSDINDEIDGHEVREMPPAIDMDLILAESVTKYTILEVANTINLKTMDRNEIRNYVQKALNTK